MTEFKDAKLFDGFPPVSTEQWEAVINKDLKGADYDKKLIWKTLEGFNVKPYYRSENLENLNFSDSYPGDFPFIRGNKKTDNQWNIRQDIVVKNVEEANKKALDVLNKGVNSLGFDVRGYVFANQNDFSNLLKNICIECIQINFVAGNSASVVLALLDEEIAKRGLKKEAVVGSADFDPLGYLTLNGKFFTPEENVFNQTKALLEFTKKSMPSYRSLSVNGQYFNNAGSSIVQELAFSFSQANQYLSELTERGLAVEDITPRMQFNFAIGSNYFLEIAKIRAARFLWAKIVEAYKSNPGEAAKMFIHSVTSLWNKTVYDPYVNMLRTTTEAMSAAIGGTDSLTVQPFDACFKESSDFSERIARNQQLVLKEESFFDKIADPAAGSYYIETLTNSIIQETWNLFVEIENKGGYVAAFKVEFIQNQLEATAQKRKSDIANRREIILGTNQYPNFNEIIDTIQVQSHDCAIHPDAIAKPIHIYRSGEEFEKLRMKTDQLSKRPKAFMLTMGNLAMRRARSQFASNFFACAGIETIDNNGFCDVEEGVKAAIDSKSEIVVICSSDEEYLQIAPAICQQLKDRAIVVLAGYPKDSIETLKEAGIKHFIHARSNVLETLQAFQKEMGLN